MDDDDIRAIVGALTAGLGTNLTAVIAGARDPALPGRWATPDGPLPAAEQERQLRAAHAAWTAIAAVESDATARTWFTGMNPVLGERSPVVALRDGDIQEVQQAAQAFLDDTWTG